MLPLDCVSSGQSDGFGKSLMSLILLFFSSFMKLDAPPPRLICEDLFMPSLGFLVFPRAVGLWHRITPAWDAGHARLEATWPWMAGTDLVQRVSPVMIDEY